MKPLFVSTVVVPLVFAAASWTQQAAVGNQSPGSTADAAQGKNIFVARCAKCHDEDANKKLADGTTLLARLAASKDPQARLATRLKNAQESRDVMTYIRPLISSLATTKSQ